MFKILTKKKCSLNTEIDQWWPTGWSHQPVDRRVSLGRLNLILHRTDELPKKNIFQSIFQKVHKNYLSIGWSCIFFGASCDGIVIRFSIIAWQLWFRCNRHFGFCLCITY